MGAAVRDKHYVFIQWVDSSHHVYDMSTSYTHASAQGLSLRKKRITESPMILKSWLVQGTSTWKRPAYVR